MVTLRREKARVLLFRVGEAPPSVRAACGDYASWYARLWGDPLEVIDGTDARASASLDVRDYDAIIVTGSPASLVENEQPVWAPPAAELVLRAHEVGVPLLGVCFGHQLIAWAMGGRVVRNPKGWELGRCEVELCARGEPLFEGLATRVYVNQTHRDVVELASLPPSVRVLAQNSQVDVQALAVGAHLRGVQFHPEIDGRTSASYVTLRRDELRAQGLDAERVLAQTGDTPDAVAMVRNFRRAFVGR